MKMSSIVILSVVVLITTLSIHVQAAQFDASYYALKKNNKAKWAGRAK